MNKEVLVTVAGTHTVDDEQETVEVITAGSYYFKNGKHFIIYEEQVEEGIGTVKNTIKANENVVELMKGGEIRAHMTFEVGKTDISTYTGPYGDIQMGITTEDIEIKEEEDKIEIIITYFTQINGQDGSYCTIVVKAENKGAAKLELV